MTRQMISLAVPVLAIGMIAGCAKDGVSGVGENARGAITYAARVKYPGNPQKSEQVQAVAMNDPDRKQIDVYNLTSQQIPVTAVWVNSAFVTQAGPIPPMGRITVKYSELLEAGPGIKDLAQLGQRPQRVDLQTGDGLYGILGPVAR